MGVTVYLRRVNGANISHGSGAGNVYLNFEVDPDEAHTHRVAMIDAKRQVRVTDGWEEVTARVLPITWRNGDFRDVHFFVWIHVVPVRHASSSVLAVLHAQLYLATKGVQPNPPPGFSTAFRIPHRAPSSRCYLLQNRSANRERRRGAMAEEP